MNESSNTQLQSPFTRRWRLAIWIEAHMALFTAFLSSGGTLLWSLITFVGMLRCWCPDERMEGIIPTFSHVGGSLASSNGGFSDIPCHGWKTGGQCRRSPWPEVDYWGTHVRIELPETYAALKQSTSSLSSSRVWSMRRHSSGLGQEWRYLTF